MKKPTKKPTKTPRHVVVCTEKRGVIFGRLLSSAPIPGTALMRVVIADAQMCVRWSAVERGVFGLASHGPTAECRIGRLVPRVEDSAHAILDATPAAVAAWKAAPWA
jgi:hypothetical protein